ncbi:hypothetical protein SAMN05443575_0878 [Jatrophihabitans endophyticus]|uniref:Imm33-like domain-containing protein n=1 Tax=Jatrophihabitans endophyticus TaxID=1206085 RepID=A0A1M5EFF9_9ACTN|nr:hypothetical protein SAMN05443575_0878 [Jatrophihabitans endophyticus]
MTTDQRLIANRFSVDPVPPCEGAEIGVARNVRDDLWPVNGMRHPVTDGVAGWYIWAGETLSNASDFFVPLHVRHLREWCPVVFPYLALPPGWRFLLAPGYEDVWYDGDLLRPGIE